MKKFLLILLSGILFFNVSVQAAGLGSVQLEPALMRGTIEERNGNTLEIKDSETGEIMMIHVSQGSFIIDAVSGSALGLDDIKSQKIAVYYGPAVALSFPPQSTAIGILCNIPEDFRLPIYAEVNAIDRIDDKTAKLTINNGKIVDVDQDTKLLPYLTRNIPTIYNITLGSKLVIWGDTKADDSQTTIKSSQIVTIKTARNFELNKEQFYFKNETPMIPLRLVAETFGYSVDWNDSLKAVTLTKGEDTHNIIINSDNYDGFELEIPAEIKGGITYVPVSFFELVLWGGYDLSNEVLTLYK